MQKAITISLLLLYFTTMAEKTAITITGKWNDKTIHLSDEVKRVLFVKTKGHLYLPDMGYSFSIHNTDGKKHHQKNITIIPLDPEYFYEYYENQNKTITLTVHPLTDETYYLKYKIPHSIREDFFDTPTVEDTIEWESVTNYKKLTYTKQWIENIDNTQEVTVKYHPFCEEIIGGEDYISEPENEYHQKPISYLAKQQLHYVANLFSEIKKDTWSKIEWMKWYNKTIQNTFENNQYNTQIWNTEIHSTPSYRYIPLSQTYGKKIIQIEPTDRQLFIFDLEKENITKKTLKPAQYLHIKAFRYTEGNLYIITKQLKWQHYQLNGDTYTLVSEKNIAPETTKNKAYKIYQTYSHAQVIYTLFEIEKTKEIYIASTTSTGKTTLKKLKDLLANTSIKYTKNNIHFTTLWYGNNDQSEFIFTFRVNEQHYILKTDKELNTTQTTTTTDHITYKNTVITRKNTIQFIKQDYEEGKSYLNIIQYDQHLQNHTNTTIKRKQVFYGNPSIITKNDDGFIIISGASSNFRFSLKSTHYNQQNEVVKEENLYSYLPIAEITSETIIKLVYFSNINNTWYTFFKLKNSLLIVKS